MRSFFSIFISNKIFAGKFFLQVFFQQSPLAVSKESLPALQVLFKRTKLIDKYINACHLFSFRFVRFYFILKLVNYGKDWSNLLASSYTAVGNFYGMQHFLPIPHFGRDPVDYTKLNDCISTTIKWHITCWKGFCRLKQNRILTS